MNGESLQALRKLMKKNKIQAYLVPSTDPHQDEYLPAMWQRRRWLSGFTGSAGDLVITRKAAGLWTDSRYFLQAEEQLAGSGINLFRIGIKDTPSISAWLTSELKPGSRVGIDPRLISVQEVNRLRDELTPGGIVLKPNDENLVDRIWKDRPPEPSDSIVPHPEKYAGESVAQKLERLREFLNRESAAAHVITNLDAIAWLFNIRGRDIDYNPLVISYAVVTPRKAMLFTDREKVSKAVSRHLGKKVDIHEYDKFGKTLHKMSGGGKKIWLDPGLTSWWVADLLDKNCEPLLKESPVTRLKAIKNPTQLSGLKTAHQRDGAAMVQFLHWLENAVKKERVSEISAARRLEEFRANQELFQGLSFETISAYQEHGAIVHYSATEASDVPLRPEGIYLIDSGAHYPDGTTDITRTVSLGNPTPEQKDRFTRVLKGHIRLAMTRFPAGTAGNQLDTIARQPLWDTGLNYGHGTGHGIGFYLNVHEGPHAISYYRGLGVALEPGMVISNEPGYYKTGEYGIRIENLIVTVPWNGHPDFLTFETISLCPIDLRLVENQMLNEEERQWLNEYHTRVRETLRPLLSPPDIRWLEQATIPLSSR